MFTWTIPTPWAKNDPKTSRIYSTYHPPVMKSPLPLTDPNHFWTILTMRKCNMTEQISASLWLLSIGLFPGLHPNCWWKYWTGLGPWPPSRYAMITWSTFTAESPATHLIVLSSMWKQLPEILELRGNNPIKSKRGIWQDHSEQFHFGCELLALSLLSTSRPSF